MTVSSRPVADSEPGARVVRSMSLRAAVGRGRVVRLEGGPPAGPGDAEVSKFFRRLSFRRQVRPRRDASGTCPRCGVFLP